MTSIAKNTAASGVWNNPPNPAAIPVTSMILPFSGRWHLRPSAWDRVAPICTATPSLPALPPNRCVIQVVTITSGMSASGISSLFCCPVSKTSVIPFKLSLLKC